MTGRPARAGGDRCGVRPVRRGAPGLPPPREYPMNAMTLRLCAALLLLAGCSTAGRGSRNGGGGKAAGRCGGRRGGHRQQRARRPADPGHPGGPGGLGRRPGILRLRQRVLNTEATGPRRTGGLAQAVSERDRDDRGARRRARHPRVQPGARRSPRQRGQELSGRPRHFPQPDPHHLLWRGAAGRSGPRREGMVPEPARGHRRRDTG